VNKNILFFANIAAPEVNFINTLYDKFKNCNITLKLLLFRTHDADINNLKPKKKIFNTTDVMQLNVDGNNYINLLNDNELLNSYDIDCQLLKKNRTIEKECYLSNLKLFLNFFATHLKDEKIDFIILNNQCNGLFEAIEKVISKKNIPHIKYLRWGFNGFYEFNKNIFEQDDVFLDNTPIKTDIEKILPKFKFKYEEKGEKPAIEQKKYFLVLLGGYELGTGIQASKHYKKRGYGWGSDIQIIDNLLNLWKEQHYSKSYELIIRQHPYTIFKYDMTNLNNHPFAYDGNAYDLTALIKGSEAVIATQTTLVLHALLAEKKVVVLGNYGLCGYGVDCAADNKSLIKWVDNINNHTFNKKQTFNHLSRFYDKYILNLQSESSVENIINKIKKEVFKNER
jgi:hypothetical protein